MENMNRIDSLNHDEILNELGIKIHPDSKLPSFTEDSDFYLHEMINHTQSGIFLFDMDLQMVVWGNPQFYSLNHVQPIHLFHPCFKDLFFRRLHKKDAKLFRKASNLKKIIETDDYYSKILRIRQEDGEYKYFLFSLFTPKAQRYKHLGKVKIGKQIDLTEYITRYNNLINNESENTESDTNENFEKLENLSKREKQILKLIVSGSTDREIARQLNISFYTVEKHRKNIIKKLNVKNTACLSFLAGKCGIF